MSNHLKPLVSIIIPVYQVEQYLDACIESILQQRYPALEVILVDDGSPDRCPAICDGYAKTYEQVKVIHQENRGIGPARNAGLRAACGTYVMFVDSDDRLDGEDAVARLVLAAEKKQADITVGSFRRFHRDEYSEVNFHHLREGAYTKTADFRFQGFYRYGHLAYLWGKLYRKSFLEEHQITCRPYPFTQDKACNMICCAHDPAYAFVRESVYLYRVNEASVTFRYKENLIPVWISIAEDFCAYLTEHQLEDTYRDLPAFHIFFGSFFIVKQELQFRKHGIRAAASALKKYGQNAYVREAMRELSHGRYIRETKGGLWKLVIPAAAFAFRIHAYHLFAAGIALLRRLQVDGRITRSRYRAKNGKS